MKLSLTLPDPLLVELELYPTASEHMDLFRASYLVRPPTRDQVKRALELDAHGEELDPQKLQTIRERQVEILAEQSGRLENAEDPNSADWKQRIPFSRLTGEQTAQLCRAILHHHLGQDPVTAEAMHQVKKKAVLLHALGQTAQRIANASTETPSSSPATTASAPPPPELSAT